MYALSLTLHASEASPLSWASDTSISLGAVTAVPCLQVIQDLQPSLCHARVGCFSVQRDDHFAGCCRPVFRSRLTANEKGANELLQYHRVFSQRRGPP